MSSPAEPRPRGVYRGGSWFSIAWDTCMPARNVRPSSFRYDTLGLRLVRRCACALDLG